MKFKLLLSLLSLLSYSAIAQHTEDNNISVALETFPPYVTADGSGPVYEVFRQVSAQSDLRFNFTKTSYKRGKQLLLNDQVDIFGVVPIIYEKEAAKNKALLLSLETSLPLDFYTKNPQLLRKLHQLNKKTIGVQIGNKESLAALTKLPEKIFVEVNSLDALIKMLASNRIKIFIAERNQSMAAIRKLKLNNISYQKASSQSFEIGLMVHNSKRGQSIKHKMDKWFNTLDIPALFSEHLKYQSLPDSGTVPLQ